jgi:hypothetical protein
MAGKLSRLFKAYPWDRYDRVAAIEAERLQ